MQKVLTTQTCYLLDFKRVQGLAAKHTSNSATNLITKSKAALNNFFKQTLKGSK